MINIIVPIVEDEKKFCEFVRRESASGVKFFVGVKESLAEEISTNLKSVKGVELHVYANGANIEEIINALSACKMQKGKILIVRRPLTQEEWQKLTNSSSDITKTAAKHNKFVSWLKNLGKMIVKKVFAFTFFDDISAICYGENIFDLVSVCKNVSMASRINKYVGVSIEDVQTQEKQVKKEYNRAANALIFTLWTLLLLGSVAGAICVGIFVSQAALVVILLMFWIVVALMCWLVGLVNFTRTLAVGNLRYGKAQEVESQFAFAEEEEKTAEKVVKKKTTATKRKSTTASTAKKANLNKTTTNKTANTKTKTVTTKKKTTTSKTTKTGASKNK